MKFGYSPRCLEHDTGPRHPETPDRLRAIREGLKRKHGVEYVDPDPATVEAMATVHEAEYVEAVREFVPTFDAAFVLNVGYKLLHSIGLCVRSLQLVTEIVGAASYYPSSVTTSYRSMHASCLQPLRYTVDIRIRATANTPPCFRKREPSRTLHHFQ